MSLSVGIDTSRCLCWRRQPRAGVLSTLVLPSPGFRWETGMCPIPQQVIPSIDRCFGKFQSSVRQGVALPFREYPLNLLQNQSEFLEFANGSICCLLGDMNPLNELRCIEFLVQIQLSYHFQRPSRLLKRVQSHWRTSIETFRLLSCIAWPKSTWRSNGWCRQPYHSEQLQGIPRTVAGLNTVGLCTEKSWP